MYQYIWDEETGGLLLTTEQSKFSKEPRPVYASELTMLGFDQYWLYPKCDCAPIMWAEANNYIYKGRLVAQTKGGTLFTAPVIKLIESPEPEGVKLSPVNIDLMVSKNEKLFEGFVSDTIKGAYNTYLSYKSEY